MAWEKTFTHPLNAPLLQAHLPLESRILDYGCGYGRVTHELVQLGYPHVVGLDSSAAMIERGRQLYPELALQVLDESGISSPANSMDAILLIAVLTCIPTNEGQRTLMADLTRVLRAGGLLYISDYALQEDERNRQRYAQYADEFGEYGVFRLSEGAVLRHHSLEWIAALTAGFDPIVLTPLDVLTMNGHAAQAFQYLGKKRG